MCQPRLVPGRGARSAEGQYALLGLIACVRLTLPSLSLLQVVVRVRPATGTPFAEDRGPSCLRVDNDRNAVVVQEQKVFSADYVAGEESTQVRSTPPYALETTRAHSSFTSHLSLRSSTPSVLASCLPAWTGTMGLCWRTGRPGLARRIRWRVLLKANLLSFNSHHRSLRRQKDS